MKFWAEKGILPAFAGEEWPLTIALAPTKASHMHFAAQDFNPKNIGSTGKTNHAALAPQRVLSLRLGHLGREPLLMDDKERHAYALIRQQCAVAKAEMLALGGIADHVHLFVALPPTVTIADFMKDVKGASARAMNNAHGSSTWAFKWQGGYSYDTICEAHVGRIVHYIENQKQHHADGTMLPACELPRDDVPDS